MSLAALEATTNSTHLTCTHCQVAFSSRSQLFRHLRTHHNLDAELEEQSGRLDTRTPAQRTDASIAARGAYQNEAHDAYYRAQAAAGVFPPQEWEAARRYFRKPLPVAFRLLHPMDPEDVRFQCWRRLRRLVPSDGLMASPSLSPHLAQVAAIPPRQWSEPAQQALMDCQEVGVANRQEVCSMVPALLLLQPGEVLTRNTLLDLCAAPGSKSLQLMDQLGKHLAPRQSALLVCNDANRQRLLTVARRSRRQPSHTRQAVCLNCSDGRYFPALRRWGGYKVKYDRVLADVPCSGDGTLRKLTSQEWAQWNVRTHLQLHRLQVRLLVRALECVAKGGRVVYSTCSLDPLENEAVVVTAIQRRGGPSVYRIVPIPPRLSSDAAEPFSYAPGATRWIVPHPQFGNAPKDDGSSTIHQTFETILQVPPALRKKTISPSMFPPYTRTQATVEQLWKDHENAHEKLQQARFYGELMTPNEIVGFEEMLPNCGRILPQHMDSGGFFVAVIERAEPSFYPVCYPFKRSQGESGGATTVGDLYQHHGRILANVKSARHMREVVAQDKQPGDEVFFEGMATIELAIEWLKQHRAYQPGISEQPWDVPSTDTNGDGEEDDDPDDNEEEQTQAKTPFKKAYVNDPNRSQLYTRLLPQPHPFLVAEFCHFFGLVADLDQAERAGVEAFPAHRLVVRGGGSDAVAVTTCQDPNEAHTILRSEDPLPANTKIHRKRRFLNLVLVSEEVRNLFQGGAKFNPTEVGLGLCSVPVPGYCFAINPGARETTPTEQTRFEDASSRAVESGRYGLLDEAAEFLGRCATKRILGLNQPQALELLEKSSLFVSGSSEESESYPQTHQSWWDRWGQQRLHDTIEWSSGAMIAAVACGSTSGQAASEQSTLFLPCVLKGKPNQEGRQIGLLAEQRLTNAWTRLLRSLLEAEAN